MFVFLCNHLASLLNLRDSINFGRECRFYVFRIIVDYKLEKIVAKTIGRLVNCAVAFCFDVFDKIATNLQRATLAAIAAHDDRQPARVHERRQTRHRILRQADRRSRE